jgi:hypothetical protein
MGPLHQPLMAERYEAFVEEHVMGKPGRLGKNLTLRHHRCHSDNAGRQDTEPVINCLSHGPACVTMSLADRLKSTDAGCLREKYMIFRHFANPCISSSTNFTLINLTPNLAWEFLHRMNSQSLLQLNPSNSCWEICVQRGAYL